MPQYMIPAIPLKISTAPLARIIYRWPSSLSNAKMLESHHHLFSLHCLGWSLYSINKYSSIPFSSFVIFLHMCILEFCSIFLTMVRGSIISSHVPSSNDICAFYHHFQASLNTLLGFMLSSLISFTASSFIAMATSFQAAFIYIYLYASFLSHPLPNCSTTTCLYYFSCVC